ncbi:hypothetical protein MHN00_08230 [Alteromonas sp. Cnat2-8]|uniref:Uncharacterized protein n=1 Tax=Alteromonas macleodii TaxID=28108 RepID=A0AB36FQW3_ALTMA|nr:hypothetical protein [Alteromonas macleodii]MCG7653537.1 hypothetical protein [Alteromonas sp. Cnat2-8]OES26333.1 hypothetical protein BFV95_4204 [Alteromonas macleodii]OES26452.1 hypothetical protein BFV94_4194 [Alteromonas macleodii]OES27235.1 hypothetical protein BFV93_4190 [Alteromonas macleodii]OES39597.1 hypothetical protein BFV96_4184 [Alteromonas macleodii]
METFFFVIFGIVYLLVWVSTADDESSDKNDQLDQLDDGMGNIIADGKHMSRQEAEDAQARGELYDTYY